MIPVVAAIVSEQYVEEQIERARHTPLTEGLPRYQHVERLGHEEVEGLLDGVVVVQEKLDGANATVARVNGEIVVASRNQIVRPGNKTFNGLYEYVSNNAAIKKFLQVWPNLILRGEWLIKHSLNYEKAYYGHLYIFDVQDRNRDFAYLHPDEYVPYLQVALEAGDVGYPTIHTVPEIARFTTPTVADLVPLSQGASAFASGPLEGIVIKRYDFVNKWGRTQWGKIVSADFKTKASINFGPRKADPSEIKFAALATAELIQKTIHKVADQHNESPRVQHMGEVMGRVWHDLFTEDLWDFVKENRVGSFDFADARKLVERQTRDTALAYYNGVPSVHAQ